MRKPQNVEWSYAQVHNILEGIVFVVLIVLLGML
jgi:hypothetical protein